MATYPISGDEIYVDARILKWHALANLLGLSTAYELDRVGGRFRGSSRSAPLPARCTRSASKSPSTCSICASATLSLPPSSTRIRLGRIRPGERARGARAAGFDDRPSYPSGACFEDR